MTLATPPSLYNQTLLSDEDFVANFVARKETFDTLCRRLKANKSASDAKHQVVIGSRGMGKTSLLRRLAIEIGANPELSAKFIPLSFREEQYNVRYLHVFWQNCADALAEWAEGNDMDELAAKLDDSLVSEGWSDATKAAELFCDALRSLGKRAVLLIDNIDLIIEALGKEERWSLRRTLQERDGPIIIGASTQALKDASKRDAAFYEFFQPSYLEPLSFPETETCMRALAVRRGEAGERVLNILQSEPERLRVLHRLAGGNPRILTLTYRFLEITDTHTTMEDLERLLDDVTPYYKARVEEYHTTLQRAIIDAIALHWDPITTKILANVMGEKSTTLSAQLSRLQKDGMIEKVETSGSYAGYQLSERFLNIWYLMRHGTRRNKQKLRWLTAFLSTFYSRNDLDDIHKQAKATGMVERWSKDFALAFEQAQKDSYQANFDCAPELGEAQAMHDEATALYEAAEFGAAIERLEAIISRFGESRELALQEEVAKAMFNKAWAHGQSGGMSSVLADTDTLILRFGDSKELAFQEHVAAAMLNKSYFLAMRGDVPAQLEGYDALIERFGNSRAISVQELVAKAMFEKAHTLGQNGDISAELEGYDTLITRFGELREQVFQEILAMAMFDRAYVLGQNGERAAEQVGYETLITRFEESEEPVILENVAIAMFNKALSLEKSRDISAAIEGYEQSLNLWEKLPTEDSEQGKLDTLIRLGRLLLDHRIDLQRAEILFKQILVHDSEFANSNLFWLYLATGQLEEAQRIYGFLDDFPIVGRSLMDAALAFEAENFGQGTEYLHAALSEELSQDEMTFDDDVERLIRVALSRDFGDRLIEWFQTTRFADRYAPLFVALVAAVKGEEHLLDTNPEVRDAAKVIYQRLVAGRAADEKGS
ncbi:MAG TPA: hypothetical protein DCS30_08365 [Rhizobiales bacterium]|nr:hypothetical protein [Hyphomicrobiales bacterium]